MSYMDTYIYIWYKPTSLIRKQKNRRRRYRDPHDHGPTNLTPSEDRFHNMPSTYITQRYYYYHHARQSDKPNRPVHPTLSQEERRAHPAATRTGTHTIGHLSAASRADHATCMPVSSPSPARNTTSPARPTSSKPTSIHPSVQLSCPPARVRVRACPLR
uniref:Uncharacterized protein n=1 Tax=Oryza glumipatula TaxID=40148 RepID=A0A0D9Y7C4_9ORYZ